MLDWRTTLVTGKPRCLWLHRHRIGPLHQSLGWAVRRLSTALQTICGDKFRGRLEAGIWRLQRRHSMYVRTEGKTDPVP
ncbi:protein of unknown function [Paraburkholderia dioscoreae]|uniref:Uncharacterized protein n=1 Tax=Paraburkholderia dioscoreae TaxID=2604047 RepID=A0A5Q4Z9X9_9BURK|nr:protein of unknown function [Paraburkholderia dioscoreae]